MEITIAIDAPVWVKKAARVAMLALAIGIAGVAFAVPKTFTSGQTLTAADLNADFSDLDSKLAKSAGGVLGVTTSKVIASGMGTTMDGPTSGYAGAKQQCAAAFAAAPNAHMCVASELVQFMAGGGVMPTTDGAWYATGMRWDGTYASGGMAPGPQLGNDCEGFSSQAGAVMPNAQLFVKNPNSAFSWDFCNTSHYILCCG
jgi:hypothetical protein